MPTAVTPSSSIPLKVKLTARQRACLQQITRRPTNPQRLVRRAKLIWMLETEANQSHITRQMHLNRGTVRAWHRRWLSLSPKLERIEAAGGSDKVLTSMITEVLTDQPRAGAPATFTAEQLVQIVAVAGEAPAEAGRPSSHWTPREVADEAIKRGIVEAISTRSVGRFLQSGGFTTPSGGVLAQHQA